MKVILCTNCGMVMKRYTNKCVRCTQTELAYYDRESSELQSEIKRITGKSDYSSPLLSMFYVALLIFTVYGAYYGWNLYQGNIAHLEPPKAQRSAAKPGTLTR